MRKGGRSRGSRVVGSQRTSRLRFQGRVRAAYVRRDRDASSTKPWTPPVYKLPARVESRVILHTRNTVILRSLLVGRYVSFVFLSN